ncbi:MAG TPA: T9SS type A sorting domain-containing protein, partial [Saprospiraceae bacterium]|nr:T9SS type A sorting domain-containing protein [Saprospiraceae bacterium]
YTFELMQNTPNPFAEITEVKFSLPEAATIKLTVFDLQGRTLVQVTDNFDRGTNSIFIDRKDLGTSGVYYYKIESGSHTATKKMVIID